MTFLAMDAFLDRVGPLAVQTRNEAEVIELTGWAPEVLDRVPPGRLERYVSYWNAKAARQRAEIERRR